MDGRVQCGDDAERLLGVTANGRPADARRILHPMLAGYARGEFQGFDPGGRSRDWRTWEGKGTGYEGLLVDNYHALLAVLDDVKAPK